MLVSKINEQPSSPALEVTGPMLEMVQVSAAIAANVPNIVRDHALQRRLRRQRRQARAAQRMARGWTIGLW